MAKKYDVLMPHMRKNPNFETSRAEEMFNRFLDEKFSYEEISNHPDYLVQASAEMLADMIPWIIEDMLKKKDLENYLIYPIIMDIDLQAYEIPTARERVEKLIELANLPFIEKICIFLDHLKDDPPIPQEEFERLHLFWNQRLTEKKAPS